MVDGAFVATKRNALAAGLLLTVGLGGVAIGGGGAWAQTATPVSVEGSGPRSLC